MPKADTITMRVDPQLKRQAEALCKDMGLTLSSAYTLFLKAIVNTRSIPFEIKASPALPKDTAEAFREADAICAGKATSKTYTSAAALIQEAKDEACAEDQTDQTVQERLEDSFPSGMRPRTA
ncbi:MAG: type II toxin-antitoxin system RelB/DinJ family antitoxin [Selenomonadaceae bacterium]|jgi:DNA-damage-inducible protein J|uniref:type II toxin-antitoxin system RelB/DinJ family antitoxin n=1 Tax=Selenomonas bovis TaxID=416586 RepID=UPI0009076F2A|nr:type II toxin-antitoxin system RelB/DinJ family antitoxin [Selenomonas bovis]MCI6752501.1 type II toxin-antitoxin system RelB/DinJ family antitoxin [Selenomonas bovis]MDY6271729.1 type II toxin-antitoxin system RelB/DinJ family antitoxin [Selenomonadaceae bacterium]MDY6299636.1 type II toxin-antitoxin system RelB/DinJ family antitoxin [Selenomonadaceae bacterium]